MFFHRRCKHSCLQKTHNQKRRLHNPSIALATVKDAIPCLQKGKSDGTTLNSNYLVLAPSCCSIKTFSSLLRHCYMPKCIRKDPLT